MQEIVNLTKDLVQFKTTRSKPDAIKRCATFIKNYLNSCGVAYKRLDYENAPSIYFLAANQNI